MADREKEEKIQEEEENTKIWMKQKELFRWNKKHIS